jgi:hypothetical protein
MTRLIKQPCLCGHSKGIHSRTVHGKRVCARLNCDCSEYRFTPPKSSLIPIDRVSGKVESPATDGLKLSVKLSSRFVRTPIPRDSMSISKCVVRLKDSHNTEHSIVIYAETLYEAVIRGLKRLNDVGWESDSGETIEQVEVEIHQEPTVHVVDVPKLLRWLNQKSGISSKDTRKEKLKKILGK